MEFRTYIFGQHSGEKKIHLTNSAHKIFGEILASLSAQKSRDKVSKTHFFANSSKLPLLSAMPAVNFPAEERHCPSTGTKLYCLVTEASWHKQLAQGCYAALSLRKLNPRPIDRKANTLLLRHCALWLMVMHFRSTFTYLLCFCVGSREDGDDPPVIKTSRSLKFHRVVFTRDVYS